MLRNTICTLLAVLVFGGHAFAQLVEEFEPPGASCCLVTAAQRLTDQLQDWNQLGRYHAANEELKQRPADPNRVVFLGDSITDGWKLEESFPGKPYVNRGISGQTTPQMLARMYADVIALKPKVVILLAGTNDIARNTGPMTAEMIQQNFMAITELAQHHGIKVVLCAVMPVSNYPYERQQREAAYAANSGVSANRRPATRSKMTDRRPPADILKLNAWLREYAGRVGAVYADYYAAFADEKGWLKEGYSEDGLHPNSAGYRLMAPVAEAAIGKAMR
ncbi:MAG: SGNH/GDSL hydrolase family protein [Bryobacterales bacterium]|nr:SGNH/GDSL hydrolase family protein [Bryobacterales bacterium]